MLQGLVRAYPAAAPRHALAGATGRHGGEHMPMSRRVDMAACRLRRALKQAGLVQLQLHSVRGVGYRLEVLGAKVQRQA